MEKNSLPINTHRTDDGKKSLAGEAASESADIPKRPTDDIFNPQIL